MAREQKNVASGCLMGVSRPSPALRPIYENKYEICVISYCRCQVNIIYNK